MNVAIELACLALMPVLFIVVILAVAWILDS
jgi:hypothetical protein